MANQQVNARSLSVILDSLPAKSKPLYEQAWATFKQFRREELEKSDDEAPNLDDYLAYFDHLRTVKKLKGTSLWSMYSRLNSMHTRLYHSRLQNWPSFSTVLTGYQAGESPKKASIFSPEEIDAFISNEALNDNKYWLTRKAIFIVAFFWWFKMC